MGVKYLKQILIESVFGILYEIRLNCGPSPPPPHPYATLLLNCHRQKRKVPFDSELREILRFLKFMNWMRGNTFYSKNQTHQSNVTSIFLIPKKSLSHAERKSILG